MLSIDAVGYSRLMNQDEDLALAVFDKRKSAIMKRVARDGGQVFGMAGDSIMAEFGEPLAALRSALALHAKIAELNEAGPPEHAMQFRVGVNTGRVVARDDGIFGDGVNVAARVQEFAPNGGVAISGSTYRFIEGKIDLETIDLGEFQLKNIVLPVQVLIVAPQRKDAAQPGQRPYPKRPSATPPHGGEGVGPPALAVLPFENQTGDGTLDYLCYGIADDVVFGLANTRTVPIISPISSFQFRDLSIGLPTVGNMLGAKYLVAGSVSAIPEGFKLKASLMEAASSRLVWTDRFEFPLAEVQEIQKSVGAQIVATLVKEVDRVEQARSFRLPWESLSLWQLVRRGRWHMQRRTATDDAVALTFFERAHEEDPNSSPVLNELSWWYLWRSWLAFADTADLTRAADYARRAMLVDSQDARPHSNLGFIDIMRGEARSAIGNLETALEINPSDPMTHTAMGSAHVLLLEPDKAIAELSTAMRLNPFEIYRFHNLGELAAANTIAGRWEDAIDAADRSLAVAPFYFYARFLKTGALARLGRMEEASQERETLLARHAKFEPNWIRWIPFADRSVGEDMLANFELARAGK